MTLSHSRASGQSDMTPSVSGRRVELASEMGGRRGDEGERNGRC